MKADAKEAIKIGKTYVSIKIEKNFINKNGVTH